MWPWLSRVPRIGARYSPISGRSSGSRREVGTFVPCAARVAADGYRSLVSEAAHSSRGSHGEHAGERAGARGAPTRSPAARHPRARPTRSSATAGRRWPRSPPPPASAARRSTATSRRREALSAALARRRDRSAPAHEPSTARCPLPYQAPGRLGRAQPLALEVTHVLDEVPPHLIADQLVAEARRAAGVAVALYVVDIDGSQLIRLAGSEDFPETLDAPPALGPGDRARGAAVVLRAAAGAACRAASPRRCGCAGASSGCCCASARPSRRWRTSPSRAPRRSSWPTTTPTSSRPRDGASRRRPPPRSSTTCSRRASRAITGAQLAGALLPAYEVGGDWFDFVENRDGSWLAIADAAGTGPTAAGLGAVRPRRPARRAAQRPGPRAGRREHGRGRPRASATRASSSPRCSPAGTRRPATLAWLNCGHPPAYVADARGRLHRARGPGARARSAPATATAERSRPAPSRLERGDRLVLVHRRDHRALRQGRRALRRRRACGGRSERAERAHGRRHRDGHPARGHGLPRPIRSRTTRRSSSSPSTERPLQDLSRVRRSGATCPGFVCSGWGDGLSPGPAPPPAAARARGGARARPPRRPSGRRARRLPRRRRDVPVHRRVADRPARRGRHALPPGAGHRARRLGLRGRPGLARRPGLRPRRRLPARVRHRGIQAGPAQRRRRARRGRRRLGAGGRRREPHRSLRRRRAAR